MTDSILNFNAGPAKLPEEVLAEVQRDLLDYAGSGMSILEISHRSAEYDAINETVSSHLLELLGLGDNFKVCFMGGGASTQFALIPMNFVGDNQTAAYVNTGTWAAKAIGEAELITKGRVKVVASCEESGYDAIPDLSDLSLPSDCAYLHLTSNNTIYGIQYQAFPDSGDVPLVCDMSSDILSRRLDLNKFSMIYAGAQKNMGPAGATAMIVRDDFLKRSNSGLPLILRHETHISKKSLYNTPPVFAVYVIGLVLKWILKEGGLEGMEKRNIAKKERIYQLMDLHPDFYRGCARDESRSWMNLTMRLPSEELEKKFLADAKAAGMVGLKGHRSVGGIRVSLYNAMPLAGADRLAQFMEDFRQAN